MFSRIRQGRSRERGGPDSTNPRVGLPAVSSPLEQQIAANQPTAEDQARLRALGPLGGQLADRLGPMQQIRAREARQRARRALNPRDPKEK